MSLSRAGHTSLHRAVHNGGPSSFLSGRAAAGLRGQFEIIVVDDRSDDGAPTRHERAASRRSTRARSGPGEARNRGAERARAPLLLFVDADVVVRPDTLARVARSSLAPRRGGRLRLLRRRAGRRELRLRYKNLLHHFVHQQSNTERRPFWAGCGAIRARPSSGGRFDARRTRVPRLRTSSGLPSGRRGFTVVPTKASGETLKRWTLPSLLRTDIFSRGRHVVAPDFESGGASVNDINLLRRPRERGANGGRARHRALSCLAPPLAARSVFAPACSPPRSRVAAVFYINRRCTLLIPNARQPFADGAFAMHLPISSTAARLRTRLLRVSLRKVKETARPKPATAPGPGRMNDA